MTQGSSRLIQQLLIVFLVSAHLSACEKGEPYAEQNKVLAEQWRAEKEERRKQKPLPRCREAKAGGPEEVVRTLYREYPIEGRKVIKNEPREVLHRFFDPRFAALLAEDLECGHSSGGQCEINWDIMYATQAEGEITDFQVCKMAPDKHAVKVQFRLDGEPRKIVYKLANTESGWRISDLSGLADWLSNNYSKLAAAWKRAQAPEPPAAPGDKRVPLPRCSRAKPGGPEDLVRALYNEYPWKGDKIIINEPKDVLSKYFDEELVAALVENQQCRAGDNNKCAPAGPRLIINYDMSISQKITGFHICAMDATKSINVQYRDDGEPTIVTYVMTETGLGWRIADVLYTEPKNGWEPDDPYDWSMLTELKELSDARKAQWWKRL